MSFDYEINYGGGGDADFRVPYIAMRLYFMSPQPYVSDELQRPIMDGRAVWLILLCRAVAEEYGFIRA